MNRDEMDKSQALTVQIFLLLGSAIICIAARSFVRFRQSGGKKNLGLEDVLAVAGVLFFVPNVVLAYLMNTTTHWISAQNTLESDFIGTQPNSNEPQLMEFGSKLYLYNRLSYSTALWALKAAFLAYVIRQAAQSGRQTHQMLGFGFLFVTWAATTLAFSQSCRPLSNMWQVYPDLGRHCQPAASPMLAWFYFGSDTMTTFYLAAAAMPLALKRGKAMRETLQWLTTGVCGLIITVAALARAMILVSNGNPGAERTAEILAIWQIFVSIVTVALTECFYHSEEPSSYPDLKDIEDARFNDVFYSSRFSARQHSLAESEVTIVVDPSEEDVYKKDAEVSVQEVGPEGRRNSGIERKIEVSVLQESFIVAPEGPCNICGNYTKGWANDDGANKPEQRSHYFGSSIHFHIPRYGRKTSNTDETMI